jgi:hypothetical protein
MKFRAIDIETYEKQGNVYKPILNARKFVLGGLKKDTGGYYEFTNRNKMAKYIIEDIIKNNKHKNNTFYYGHATAYDFYGIFSDYLDKGEIINLEGKYKIETFSIYPFIAYFIDIKTNKTIGYFLDSMSFYRSSLSEVGDLLNFKKLKMPQEIKMIGELHQYLKRDCEIVLQAMLKVKQDINDLGFYPKKFLTSGNVSITAFLTHCTKNNLRYIFQKKGRTFQGKHIKEIRGAYRGGRCECFQKGFFKDCIKLDVNSEYPYIMQKMEFPNLNSEFKVKGKRAKDYLKMIGVMKCSITAPSKEKLRYAYLPIRFGGYVHFPHERELNGMWTTLEIRKALKLGYTLNNIEWGVFYKTSEINPFKKYIQLLYDKKSKSQGAEKQVYKLLLNSLYGKWGQENKIKEFKNIKRKEYDYHLEKGWEFVKTSKEGYLIKLEKESTIPRYANVMISLLITAEARNYLWENMMKIPTEELIYVATDCLLFKPKDLYNLKKYNIYIGKKIGAFKIEDRGDCLMYGENRYKFNGKVKIGGIPKRDRTNETLEKGEITIKRMISIKQAMKTNDLKGKIGTFIEETKKIGLDTKNDITLPLIINEQGESLKWI